MNKDNFDFLALVEKYKAKVALNINQKTYTYEQLAYLTTKRSHQIKERGKIINVNKQNALEFIIEFLAIKQSGNYPFLTSKTKVGNNLSYKKEQVNFKTLFLGLTSGTTGEAKIYLRNWSSWVNGFEMCDKTFDLKNIEAIVTDSPLTTSLGFHALIMSLYLGKTFCLVDSVAQLTKIKQKFIWFVVPTFLLQNLKELPRLNNLKTIFLGGGTLENSAINAIEKRLKNTDLIEYYGTSETSFISWQKVNGGKKTHSVGKLFLNVEVIIGPQDEIIVKSPYLFSGYLNEVEPKIWITDDLGKFSNGNLYLMGRRADLIDHGGNKVSPYEVEEVTKKFCDTCVVFGVKDEIYGQKIAVLMVNPKSKKVILAGLLKELPKYKCPQIYLKADSIPLTKNQKISRFYLEENYLKGKYNEF